MARTVMIELPDGLEDQLADQAGSRDLPLEEIVLQSLIQSVRSARQILSDPITPLVGTLSVATDDIAEHHDAYLPAALQEALRRAG